MEILDEALDYMQAYNGRTKIHCIALAMCFEYADEDYEGEETYVKL